MAPYWHTKMYAGAYFKEKKGSDWEKRTLASDHQARGGTTAPRVKGRTRRQSKELRKREHRSDRPGKEGISEKEERN